MRFALITCILVAGILTGCTNPAERESNVWELSALPQVSLESEWEREALDTLLLGNVGFHSVPLPDGSFLIANQRGPLRGELLQAGPGGELIRRVTGSGEGPGEIRSVTSFQPAADGGILVYDRVTAKVLRYNSRLEVQDEFVVENYEGSRVDGVYSGPNDSTYIVEYRTGTISDRMEDPYSDIEIILVSYTPSQNRYRPMTRMHGSTYVPRITNGRWGSAGMTLKYAPTQFLVYHPKSETFYLHESGTGLIAEVDASFDTLRTLPLKLRHEEFTTAEMDTLREEYAFVDWDTVTDKLSERKNPVGAMKVGSDGSIWLQLNYRGDSQRWLVLDNEGSPKRLYHLPIEVHLMHVGDGYLLARTRQLTHIAYYPIGV